MFTTKTNKVHNLFVIVAINKQKSYHQTNSLDLTLWICYFAYSFYLMTGNVKYPTRQGHGKLRQTQTMQQGMPLSKYWSRKNRGNSQILRAPPID
jgi:hypothetical protein